MTKAATVNERRLTQQISCYYDLHVPVSYDDDKSWPLLIALHGYEGTKESMMKLSLLINDSDWLIASLQGPYQFLVPSKEDPNVRKVGFGWLTPYKAPESVALHHRNVIDLIDKTAVTHNIDRSKIFLMGFSQAVALNYRFVFSNPGIIRGVIGVCGGIPGDFQEKPYHNVSTEVLHIAGTSDEYYPIERAKTFGPILETKARSVDFRTYDVGHVFPRQSFSGINEWITAKLNTSE